MRHLSEGRLHKIWNSLASDNVKAVIFDIYNTLFENSTAVWEKTFQDICSEQDLPVDPHDLYTRWRSLEAETRKGRVNLAAVELSHPFRPYREVWKECFSRVFEESGLGANASTATSRAITDMGRRQPYPDSLNVVKLLQKQYKTAALSNADESFLYPVLEKAGLVFDAVLCSEAVGVYKPHPLPFERILEMLRVNPSEAVFVGDTMYDDILGAQQVGMRTVLVNWDKSRIDTSLVAPDQQVHRLTDLLDMLAP